jgi:uncharacterized protein YjbJ (UPF0337 family)
MSFEDKAKAAAKNLEGKAQEAAGQITGDPAMRHKGQAKQAEAEARNIATDLKEKVKDVAEKVHDSVESAAKSVAGKVEEFVGDKTDDPEKVIKGKAKQAEAEALKAKEKLS